MIKYFRLFLLGGVKPRIVFHIELMQLFKRHGFMKLARFLESRMQLRYGVYISHRAQINGSINFKHPVGVVIGEGVVINGCVTIYQGVTLGGARVGDAKNSAYPVVNDGVVIFAGAVVVGKINIGKNAVVGANSVVLQDVPENCTAVGAPARVIRNKE